MDKKLKILILVKPFWVYPKHKVKKDIFDALEKYANVYYWHMDGHIQDILKTMNLQPDFIFHYDIAWNTALSPMVDGLADIDIPKGCFVIDLHWQPNERIRYFTENNIDLIFSATKHPFLQTFPNFKDQFRWLPWSINPDIMKDYGLKKEIDTLLMGLVYIDKNIQTHHRLPKVMPPKGRYAFRDTVFEQMKDEPGFVYHPHPGHLATDAQELIVNEDYAKELNRTKLFFTCGGRHKTGRVAVLKFFEAPACKTLLLAEPNEDILELGFKDKENFISCTVDDFKEKAAYYLANEQERIRITENGYRFVQQHHTHDERAKQMLNEISALL
ncbi:glycosyltransferase [Siminovitchia sediminis]|uniref:Glycosyltransferase n=1 Tax=Siminovitchia sediminis TaxID=1274353 RepID=A0ABW4KI52_9BACI